MYSLPTHPSTGMVERLDLTLSDLESISGNPSSGRKILQELANQAQIVLTELRSVLKRSQVQEVAQLVRDGSWVKASEAMNHNFPGGSIGSIEEVMELVYVDDHQQNLLSAIKWVGHLDVQLRPRAYEAIYEQIKMKGHTDKMQMLLMQDEIKMLPANAVMKDDVRAQLDNDCFQLIECIVSSVNLRFLFGSSPCMPSMNLFEIMKSECFSFAVQPIVSKWEDQEDGLLLLLKLSQTFFSVSSSCCLIDALWKVLEARSLQDSEQAMHLYAHAKYIKEYSSEWSKVPKDVQKLCTDVWDKMAPYQTKYFQFYQVYIEEENKESIVDLHFENVHLESFAHDFTVWYCNGDFARFKTIFEAAKTTSKAAGYVAVEFLHQLYIEMVKWKQMYTFEALCLFNDNAQLISSIYFVGPRGYKEYQSEPFKGLQTKAPACLRLILAGQQLRLVNKFYYYDLLLCVNQDKTIWCSSPREESELLCKPTVDPDTALTIFTVEFGESNWKLAASDGKLKLAETGTQWRITPVDEHHVKISSAADGKNRPKKTHHFYSYICLIPFDI